MWVSENGIIWCDFFYLINCAAVYDLIVCVIFLLLKTKFPLIKLHAFGVCVLKWTIKNAFRKMTCITGFNMFKFAKNRKNTSLFSHCSCIAVKLNEMYQKLFRICSVCVFFFVCYLLFVLLFLYLDKFHANSQWLCSWRTISSHPMGKNSRNYSECEWQATYTWIILTNTWYERSVYTQLLTSYRQLELETRTLGCFYLLYCWGIYLFITIIIYQNKNNNSNDNPLPLGLFPSNIAFTSISLSLSRWFSFSDGLLVLEQTWQKS